MTAKKNVIKFSYIENGPNLNPAGRTLRKDVYDLWYPQWTQIYKSWNSTNVPNFRDFMLYDYIHCISVDGEIAGITAHRLLNLEEPLNQSLEYIQSIGQENVDKIYALGLRNIMTIESLLVSPSYRRTQSDFQLGKSLLYLANETFALSAADGIVGTARKDVKVPELSFTVGYEVIQADRDVRTIPCDVVLQRKREVRNLEDPTWILSHRLWEERDVHESPSFISPRINKNNKNAA